MGGKGNNKQRTTQQSSFHALKRNTSTAWQKWVNWTLTKLNHSSSKVGCFRSLFDVTFLAPMLVLLWYLWTITWILLNELEIGNCKLNVIWLYVLKLYAQIVANCEVCAMRTISMHYKTHTSSQKKEKPIIIVLWNAVKSSDPYHTLLKNLNAHKTEQCWNVCNAISCFCRIVNIYRVWPVPYAIEKLERSRDWTVLKRVQCYLVFLSYREHLPCVLKKVTILKASKNQGTRCRKKAPWHLFLSLSKRGAVT